MPSLRSEVPQPSRLPAAWACLVAVAALVTLTDALSVEAFGFGKIQAVLGALGASWDLTAASDPHLQGSDFGANAVVIGMLTLNGTLLAFAARPGGVAHPFDRGEKA